MMIEDQDRETQEEPAGELFDISPGHRSGFIALVGRPNVGKSTLMNAFMQQKIAAVTPRPQTTRTRQLGIITEPDYQMIFIDTPGIIQKPRHDLDRFMVESALETLEDADVILWLLDISEPVGSIDREISERLASIGAGTKTILALNKIDLIPVQELLPRTEAFTNLLGDADWIHLSALNGVGVGELLEQLAASLPEGPRYYPPDQITDVYIRNIAGELIREQLMLQLRDEVPYGTAVQVREYKERENGTVYISADIYVESQSHKSIVIGKGGSQLKQLGAAAREQIEKLVDGKVFLELWVKVEPNWRRSERLLKQFGYRPAE
jgi:GTPase